MRWLLFLSRLAFICGLFFLLSFSLMVANWTRDEAITSTIIIIGHLLGIITVPLVNICYLFVLILRKRIVNPVPAWLITANIFFLLILLLYIFIRTNYVPIDSQA